jgi:hypothetical protein
MAIKFDTFTAGGGTTPNLDAVTTEGASTTNAITVGGVTVGTEYTLPTTDGTANQVITTNGSGTLSFTTLDFTGGLQYLGAYDITAGADLTSSLKGDFYIISNGPGTIAGVSFEDGDHIVFNQDASSPLTSAMFDKIDNSEAYTTLASLTDVTITSASTGEVLRYNGTQWVDAQLAYSDLSGTPTNVSTFTNDAGYLTTGDNVSVLTNDANYVASGDNVSVLTNDAGYLTDITAEPLGDLSDVTITSVQSGEVLSYNGTAWVNSASSAGSLAGLSDTTITDAVDGDYLRHNGTAWVDATLSIVDDSTPQLGGALDTNGNAITSASNADVTINPNGTGNISIGADLVPDADATHSIGSEDNRYVTTFSDLNGAIRFKAKNDEGVQITKGQVVYIKGLAGDGTTPTVGLADADDASKMPAFGLAFNTANDQAEVQIVSVGNLGGLNTSGFSVGDTLYVDTTAGAITNTKPTGETAQLQNIGRVIRSDNGAGVIMVGGAGRSSATPNLDQNKIFLGNASNQSVSTALSSIALSSFNDDLSYLSAGDNVSTLTNDAGYLTGITAEPLNDLSDVTITTVQTNQVLQYNGTAWVNATIAGGVTQLDDLSDVTITSASTGEVLRYNGTQWVDAQLAYSDLSGTPTNVSTFTNDANYVASGDNVSVLTNDAGYLTGITGESVGDLSDVTITSASTGEVLRYNGTAWVDAQLAYSDLSGTPTNVSTFTNDAGYLTGITAEPLNDLSDVTITSVQTNDVLQYNGTAWVNAVVSSGGGYTYSAITADPANAQAGYHYSCTGTFTITLPTSGLTAGQEIRIKNMGTGTITVDPQTASIDGSTTDYVLDVQYSAITLVVDGSNNYEVI